jgi:hypothetical protein
MNTAENNNTNTETATGTTGLVLGIVTMILWFIPLFGIPLSIWGLVSSVKAKGRGAKGKATAGLVLCIISLTLGVINASIGAYQGATGQHPLINSINTK